MKKANKNRQALLQKKRTKRNQSRKGVKYDPNKLLKKAAQTVQVGTPSTNVTEDGKTVFTI
jgi:hypothetical protein